jgi:hypothetical protein
MPSLVNLISSLPQEWKDKVTEDFAKLKTESPTIVDPESEKNKFFVTLIIQPDIETRKKIYDTISFLDDKFPGLYIQPYEGYHFSIQWSDTGESNLKRLILGIQTLEIPKLKVDIKLCYPSKNNIFAAVIPINDQLWMTKIRGILTPKFTEAGYTPRLPDNLPLMWISLIKFTKDFDSSNIVELVDALPKLNIKASHFKLILAKSDPYFSQSSANIYLLEQF